jgi:rubrerythrin
VLLPSPVCTSKHIYSVHSTYPTTPDTVILQYALTLEHLEDTFYHQALSKFDDKAFKKAGFPSWVRGRFAQIAEQEASHVAFLTTALGADAVPACSYKLLVTSMPSFAHN